MAIPKIKAFLFGFTCVPILSVAFILYTGTCKSNQNVFVDIDKILNEITRQLSTQALSDIELKEAIVSYKLKFDAELDDYERENKAIIFSSPKPIRGAVDKTDYFLRRLQHHEKILQNQNSKQSSLEPQNTTASIEKQITTSDEVIKAEEQIKTENNENASDDNLKEPQALMDENIKTPVDELKREETYALK